MMSSWRSLVVRLFIGQILDIEMTPEEKYIAENFHHKTNRQLADELSLKLYNVRQIAYSLGLFRIDLEYWTDEQVDFLKGNFENIGDTELAQIFEKKFPKTKNWTKKHIEKKRRYLGLNRTKEQILLIKQRNKDLGMYAKANEKMWEARGKKNENEIVYWNNGGCMMPYIKINARFTPWARYVWCKAHGELGQEMKVVFKDGDNRNLSLENLEVISSAEHAKRNSLKSSQGLSDNYVAGMMSHKDYEMRKELLKNRELLETKRLQLKLSRICRQK